MGRWSAALACGLALLVASTARRRGTAIARMVGFLLACYIVHSLAQLSTVIAPLAWATPFQYFDPIRVTIEPDFPWVDQAILLGTFAVSTILAFRRFETRDL